MSKRAAIVGVVALGVGIWVSLATGAFLRQGVQSDGKSSTPVLSADAKGRVYLVWVDTRIGRPALFFNRSDDGGSSWRNPDQQVFLSPSEASRVYEPEVWGDGQGNVYAVWRLRHQGDEIWFAASRDFGATWKPAVRISSRGTGFLPHLSADGSGRVYAVWYEELARGRQYAVHFNASSDRGEAWLSRDIRLDQEDPPGTAALPWLASDEAGHVYVVWREARNGPQEVVFTTSADAGKTWSSPVKLSQSRSLTEHPKVATDGAGHVYVIWRDWRNGSGSDLYFTASADHGRTWFPTDARLNTNPPGTTEAFGPELRAAPQGQVYVTWMDRRNGRPDVFFTASADHGKSWQGNLQLSHLPADDIRARLPRLAADRRGQVWIVWEEHGPLTKLFYSLSPDFGKTWLAREMPLQPLDSTKAMHAPSLGILPQGELVVAWEERRRPATFVEAMDPTQLPSDVTMRLLTAP